MSAKDFNHVQMISFLFLGIGLAYLLVRFVYIKMDEYNLRKQKESTLGGSWKVIRPDLNQEEVNKLILNIEEFNEKWSNLNADFVSGDKNARGDFNKLFNELYRKYLELALRGESIINDKNDGLGPKHLKTKELEHYVKRLKEKKESIDIIKEDLNMEVQEKQRGALNILTIAETIFLPLGVLVGFFGMNFSRMDKDGAFATFGITKSVKSAHLLMWSAILIVASLTAIGLKYFFLKGDVSNFDVMNKLVPDNIPLPGRNLDLPGYSDKNNFTYI